MSDVHKTKIFWIGVFLVCIALTVYLTVDTVREYSNNPTLNTFGDDEPIYKIPFPGTSIAGTMILRNNPKNKVYELYNKSYQPQLRTKRDEVDYEVEFVSEGLSWTRSLIDFLVVTIDHFCELANSFAARTKILDLDQVENLQLREDSQFVDSMNITLHDDINDPKLRNTIVPFLKNITLDCKNIFGACMWEGHEKNCTEIFVPVQTDVGNGCSFNRIPDKLLRRGEGLMSVLNNYSYTGDEIRQWEKFRMDSQISVEGFRDFKDMVHPRVQHHAGKLTGLSFMLIFDQNVEGMGCPIVDSYGYLVGIHSPFEEPRLMQTAVTVPPNMEVFIKVKAEVITADKQIKTLSIGKRRCYFQNENPLKNFLIYTVGNCHQECLGSKIYNACNCTLLTLSAGNKEVICGPNQAECVEIATSLLESGGYDRFCQDPVCLSACTEIKYDADVSYLPYYQRGILNFSSRKTLSNDLVTSIVHVTHATNTFTTRERKLQFGFSILLGVIGGTWGFTLQFSFVTIFNLLAGIAVLMFPDYLKVENDDDNADDRSLAEESVRRTGPENLENEGSHEMILIL